jgi:hypothetical protein
MYLLHIATHYSTRTGITKGDFLNDVLTAKPIKPEQFDDVIDELIDRGLLKRGLLEKDPHSDDVRFIESPEGNQFRVPQDVKTAFLTKVLKLRVDPSHPDFDISIRHTISTKPIPNQ